MWKLVSCQIKGSCQCGTELVVSAQKRVSIVPYELEGCYSCKNELVLAMEMVEDDCGFALVFIASNALCLGRI